MSTYSVKPKEITRVWYVLDASQAPLGRVSTKAASLLLGKGKPSTSPHMDVGDFVIVINASSLVVTGNKRQDKMYHNHSGFPGGLRTRSLQKVIDTNPAEVITKSIRGMLPVNKLRDGRLKRLKVYAGAEHNHSAQTPVIVSLSPKEKK
jgi:large subunit ribosomal protein L13